MAKFDSQGWIDARTARGRPYAFFVRNDRLWVRRDDEYKCTRVGGSDTMAAARGLAEIIVVEEGFWMDEAHAKKLGLPSD